MATVPVPVDVLLRSLLQGYQYPDQTRTDVGSALLNFKDLKPQKKEFVFNDGSTKKLVCLEGTVPITYKGNLYNIPVVIWLVEAYPYQGPMVFVVPTNTMSIRSGPVVDMSGKVTMPYLTDWRYPTSDMAGLLQVLAHVFGDAPPVFAKPPSRPAQPTASVYGGGNPSPQQQLSAYAAPGSAAGQVLPSSQTPYMGYPSGVGSGAGAHQLPYPATPSLQYSSSQMPGSAPLYPPSASSGTANFMPQLSQAGYGQPNLAAAATYSQQPLPYPAGQGHYAAATPQSLPYSAYSSPSMPYPNSGGAANIGLGGYPQSVPASQAASYVLPEEQVKLSLRTAVEDKMRRKLRERYAQAAAEMDVLRKMQEELASGEKRLTDMDRAIAEEQKEVEKTKKFLQDKIEEMKQIITKLDSRDQMDPEEVVVTTAPLYKQLLASFAEEQAIEDVLYCLGEGLRKNVVDLDVYLKKVRELSRRQFLLRALMQKCREKAGLSDVYGC